MKFKLAKALFCAKVFGNGSVTHFGDLQKTLVPSLAKVIGFSDEKPKDATSAQLAELAQKSAANFAQGLQDLSQQLSGQELVKLADMLIKPELVTVQRDDFNNGTDKNLAKLILIWCLMICRSLSSW